MEAPKYHRLFCLFLSSVNGSMANYLWNSRAMFVQVHHFQSSFSTTDNQGTCYHLYDATDEGNCNATGIHPIQHIISLSITIVLPVHLFLAVKKLLVQLIAKSGKYLALQR